MLLDRPASALALYAHTTHLWKITLKRIYLVAFLCAVIPISISQYVFSQTVLSLLVLVDTHQQFHLSYTSLLLILVNIFISMASYAALLTYVNSFIKGKPCSGLSLIRTVLIKTPLLIIALLISAASFLLGSLLFLIPGLYVIGIIFLFYPIVILESNNPFKDFRTAFRLIRNNWWRTFFTIALPIIVFTTCISSFAVFVATFSPLVHHEYTSLFIKLFIQALLLSFFFPWICIQILSLLNDLKMRKGAIRNY